MNRRGILLVFVSGFLVVLALAGVLLLNLARFTRAGAGAALAGKTAALAAQSGSAYAETRLFRDAALPERLDALTRGDDWTFREGVVSPLTGAANPSYSHGECWTESGGREGTFDLNVDDLAGWTDLDGDGRFSARSGRLRDASRPVGLPFSLKIVPAGGKIPVNAGSLAAGESGDTQFLWHRGLARVLNNLGALLLAPRDAIERKDLKAGESDSGEPIRMSRLGDHLVEDRPAGGYRTERQVRTSLAARGYAAEEIDAVLPFVDIGFPERAGAGGRPGTRSYSGARKGAFPFAAVDLAGASREVLTALWMYVSAYPGFDTSAPGFDSPYGRNGFRSGTGGMSFNSGTSLFRMKVMIYPDEAEGLAAWVERFRRLSGRLSWRAFREDLLAHAAEIFAAERAMLLPDFPQEASDWTRAKADLAFFAMTLDMPPALTPSSWMGWGFDHGTGFAAGDMRPFTGIHLSEGLYGVPYTEASGRWYRSDSKTPYHLFLAPAFRNRYAIWPVGLSLAPPGEFLVEAASPGALLSGRVRVAERLEFTSQEDFENFEGNAALLAERGILVVDPDPAARRPIVEDPVSDVFDGSDVDPSPRFPGVATLPYGNLRGMAPGVPGEHWRYCHSEGALALAARACGLQGSARYFPFTEDFLAGEPEGELSSETEGAGLPHSFPLPAGSWLWGPWSFGGAYAGPPDFECPWTPDFGNTRIEAFSVEMWVGLRRDSSVFRLLDEGGRYLELKAVPLSSVGGRPAEKFHFATNWKTGPDFSLGLHTFSADVAYHDVASGRSRTDAFHVVLSFEDTPATGDVMRIVLYVDGKEAGRLDLPTAPEDRRHLLLPDRILSLELDGADEVRFFRLALKPDQVQDLYGLGRYPIPVAGQEPVYRSPLYDPGENTPLDLAGWTILPAGEPAGAERVEVRVSVHGYADSGGTVELPGSPVTLPDGAAAADLSGLGPVRSFRYEVRFVNRAPTDVRPLYRTPFFESIWFRFARRGRFPAWLSRDE